MSTLRALNRFLGDRGGSITVEFVALVPVLISGLVFSFEFGRALWAYDVVTRDVRGAVRYLSRAPSTYTDQAQCMAMTGLPVGAPPTCNSNPKHFPWTDAASFVFTTTPFSSANYNEDGFVITMTATAPVALPLLDFISRILGLGGASIETDYPLTVSYNARYIGN